MIVTAQTTFQQIREDAVLREFYPWLLGTGNDQDVPKISLSGLQKQQPTWNANDMAFGLNRLLAIRKQGIRVIYDVYSKEEQEADIEKKKSLVKLFRFPAMKEIEDNVGRYPFVIIAAGGGYGCVASIVEAFPVAARLNEMGFSVFCLNYRVGGPHLMPKPMDDLGAAFKCIAAHAEEWKVDMDHYAVCGFSAGGHLAGCWGLKEFGFQRYDFSKPDLLMLIYPLINVYSTISQYAANRSTRISNVGKSMLRDLFGSSYVSVQDRHRYEISELIDQDYPATYICYAEDDEVVCPDINERRLITALEHFKVPVFADTVLIGGHGFGLGSETAANGWVEGAVAAWNQVSSFRY